MNGTNADLVKDALLQSEASASFETPLGHAARPMD
jgi:hypothetical protein